MEIGTRQTGRGVYHLAALALVLMGLGLVYLSWHNVNQQKELVERHAMLSARVILRGLEANLMRGMRRMGGRGPQDPAPARVEEYFREVVESGEVRYLGLYSPKGAAMLYANAEPGSKGLELAPNVWRELEQRGEWFGEVSGYGKPLLVFASLARPGLASFCGMTDCEEPAPQPEERGRGQGPGRGRGQAEAPPVLVIGLEASEYYAPYEDFRRAALIQTGYVLATAFTLWLLFMAYLRRRGQGKRLIKLEIFRSRLLDALPDGLITLDSEGLVKAANPAAKEILRRISGDSPSELVGTAFKNLALSKAIDDCLSQDCGWRQFESQGASLELLALPLTSADEQEPSETLILARDRTQIKRLEDDLAQTRELAAVGSLAAGVAHEIRNPLSSLRGFAQFFLAKLAGREPEQTYARTMVEEADRLNRVVTDLLFLAKPRQLALQELDLPAVAGNLRELLAMELKTRAVDFELDLRAPSLWADKDGLTQALLNLMLNALAALPETGGRIKLSSQATEAGVELKLADNGRGMSEEEADKAFEPFFTSKAEGSGLGLAIVRKIMREHKGQAKLLSTSSQGTEISLLFPDRFAGGAHG